MPMYWDSRAVDVEISGAKREVLADFIYSVIHQRNYFQRGGPEVFTLDEQHIDNDTAVVWAHIKRSIDPLVKHLEAYHAEGGLAEHELDPDFDEPPKPPKPGSILAEREWSASHGHMVPPVFIFIEEMVKLMESDEAGVSLEEYEAARDELLSFEGFKVAAAAWAVSDMNAVFDSAGKE